MHLQSRVRSWVIYRTHCSEGFFCSLYCTWQYKASKVTDPRSTVREGQCTVHACHLEKLNIELQFKFVHLESLCELILLNRSRTEKELRFPCRLRLSRSSRG